MNHHARILGAVLGHVSNTCSWAPAAAAVDAADSSTIILAVKGRTVYDSRGGPTVEVEVTTGLGVFRAAVPSGASTGTYEALELRDGDPMRWHGKGVERAVANVNDIIGPALEGRRCSDQSSLDTLMVRVLDGTQNEWGWCKQKLGANAILAVSLACCKAGAVAEGLPLYKHLAKLSGRAAQAEGSSPMLLPVPSFNIINGGSHAGNKLAMQEFMILPTGAATFAEAMRMGAEVYQTLKGVIQKRYGLDATNVGDEGGFAPNIQDNMEGLELIVEAIEQAGYTGKVEIAMDVAASEFFIERTKHYDLDFKTEGGGARESVLSPTALTELYTEILQKYPVCSIEDPFDQDDWEAYAAMSAQVGEQCQIVGDDLLVTNPKRVQKAIAERSCNALLLKVNQIGSVTEAIEAVAMAQAASWGVMTSHRSGETEDSFIADLAVGLGTGQIKAGAPCRSERLAKYNQLLRIEEELGPQMAVFAGRHFRSPDTALLQR